MILRFLITFYLCIPYKTSRSVNFYQYFIPYKYGSASTHHNIINELLEKYNGIFKKALTELLKNGESLNDIFYGYFTPEYNQAYGGNIYFDYQFKMINPDYKIIVGLKALSKLVNLFYDIIFLKREGTDYWIYNPNRFHINIKADEKAKTPAEAEVPTPAPTSTPAPAPPQAPPQAPAPAPPPPQAPAEPSGEKELQYRHLVLTGSGSKFSILKENKKTIKREQNAYSEPDVSKGTLSEQQTDIVKQLNTFTPGGFNSTSDFKLNDDHDHHSFAYMSALMYKTGDVIETKGQNINGWKIIPIVGLTSLHLIDEDSPYLASKSDKTHFYYLKYVMCTWYKIIDNKLKIAFVWRGAESKRDFVYNSKKILENPEDSLSIFDRILKFQFNVIPRLPTYKQVLIEQLGIPKTIEDDIEYYVTGHSLGGYMALLSAVIMKMINRSYNINIVLFNPFMGNYRFKTVHSQNEAKIRTINEYLSLFEPIPNEPAKYRVYHVQDTLNNTIFQSDIASDFFQQNLQHTNWRSPGVVINIANTQNITQRSNVPYSAGELNTIDTVFRQRMWDMPIFTWASIKLGFGHFIKTMPIQRVTRQIKQSIAHAHSMGHFLGNDKYNELLHSETDLICTLTNGAIISMNGVGIGTLSIIPPLVIFQPTIIGKGGKKMNETYKKKNTKNTKNTKKKHHK
jgi:hypothetical protein